jgi:hypothetical protein
MNGQAESPQAGSSRRSSKLNCYKIRATLPKAPGGVCPRSRQVVPASRSLRQYAHIFALR